jgi:hypothetical protein
MDHVRRASLKQVLVLRQRRDSIVSIMANARSEG